MSQGLYTVDPTDTASHGGWPVHTYYLWCSSGMQLSYSNKEETTSANNSNVAGWKPISTSEVPSENIRNSEEERRLQTSEGQCASHLIKMNAPQHTCLLSLTHKLCISFLWLKEKETLTIEIWFPHDFHSFFPTFYFCFMYTSFLFCNVWRTPVRVHVQTTKQFFSWA